MLDQPCAEGGTKVRKIVPAIVAAVSVAGIFARSAVASGCQWGKTDWADDCPTSGGQLPGWKLPGGATEIVIIVGP